MTAVDAPAIRAIGIGKSYAVSWCGKPRVALDDISFEVPAGSIVALVGVNGAGKSTLLRILAGLSRVDRGEVTVFGQTPREASRSGRISYLPDAPHWPDHLRLNDFVDFSVRLLGRPAAEGDGLLDSVGLASRSASKIRECSRGMRQRLGLAWAMLGEPGLLLLDEVFAGLDPGATDDAAAILRRAAGRGTSILFTSHYPEQAQEVADRMIMLHEGRVVFSGDRHGVAVAGGWREIFRGKALS